LAAVGAYRIQHLLGGTREYALVFNAISSGLILSVFATFLLPELLLARGWLLMAWILAIFWVDLARFWLRRGVYALRGRGWFLAPALLVGVNDEAAALAAQLANSRYSGLNVLGFVAAEHEARPPAQRNLYALGSLAALERLVARHDVEELIVATSGIHRTELVDLFRRFGGRPGLRLRFSGGLFEIVTTGLEVSQVAAVSLLDVAPVRLRGADWLLKWLLDKGLSLLLLVLGAPLMALIALAVRLDSPGPVLHRRRVLGLGGSEFDAFKFRSMRVDGDAILAQAPELAATLAREHKLKDDPRVTRVGGWLRRTSLDELPQLVNVLRGEMSIVGPRMIAPAEHEQYGQWDLNLLTVKPGITGLWQVSGRSDLSYDERVRLDMSYIRNWTIWLDLQILVQTLPAVLARRGAY
ncbi:MAG: sugar transferase, partial [Chloroflexi bacterium]|nr:sugar transferase [Chloroflexota bacterium]